MVLVPLRKVSTFDMVVYVFKESAPELSCFPTPYTGLGS